MQAKGSRLHICSYLQIATKHTVAQVLVDRESSLGRTAFKLQGGVNGVVCSQQHA